MRDGKAESGAAEPASDRIVDLAEPAEKPLAIGLGEGSELQSPLARVVVGGLLASTAITLVLIGGLGAMVETALKVTIARARPELDALVFADDNPVERESVRQLVPEVDVLRLPSDPAGYVRALADYPWFETTRLTEEDAARTEQAAEAAEPGQCAQDGAEVARITHLLQRDPAGPGRPRREEQVGLEATTGGTTAPGVVQLGTER